MRKRPPSCSLSPVLSPSVFLDWDDTRLGHLFDEGFYGDPREAESFPWHWQPLQCEDLEGLLPAYQVIRMLGRGSMGAVYEARHRRLGRHVALKVLPGEISDHPGTAARFRQEAETLARLAHPGIVAVYDSGETIEGHLYYAMEYVDGEDLASRMARQPIPLEEGLPILLSLCQALAFLHRAGIVHRDIKPANLLLTPASPQAKLADFGLAVSVARELGLPALTRPRHTLGTLEYAAPEQLAHLPGQNVGPTADLYSLGVVAYQLLTGELPRGVFDPPSLRNPSLDPAFDAVILRVLQRDPTRRFPDAETFAAALQQAADRPLQHALKEKALRRKLNRRARWIALFAAVALLSTSSAVYAWKARRQAYQSRVEAEQAQTKTEDLLQFLLTDLRKRLEPTGNLSALDSVMSRAASHFRTEWTQASASDESTLALAQVLTLYGDVIGVRGLHAQADALYTEVIGLREGMRRRQPNQPTYAVLLLEALQDRSEHRMSGGNFTGALQDAERMDRESQTTLALWPRNPTLLQLAANADIAQGNALAYDTDRFDDAALAYHRAQSRLRLLDTDFPELGSQRHRLATLETSLGSLAEGRGAFEEMARHFAAYRDYILQEFGPESSAYSHAAFRMGVAMNKTGNHAQAETYLHDAVRLAEAELARQPGHTGALNHLRWCLGEYVRAFEAQENLEAASRYRQREAEVAAALQSATAAAPN